MLHWASILYAWLACSCRSKILYIYMYLCVCKGSGHYFDKCFEDFFVGYMSRDMRFPTMWYVRPAKAQTSLRIRAVWSEPLLVAWIYFDSWATDWTSFGVSKLKRRLHRLVWVYNAEKYDIRICLKPDVIAERHKMFCKVIWRLQCHVARKPVFGTLIMPEGKKKYLCLVKIKTCWLPSIHAIHAPHNKSSDTDCVNGQADRRSCCHIM